MLSIRKKLAAGLACAMLATSLAGCAGSAAKKQLDNELQTIISDKDHPLAAAGVAVVKDGKIAYANTVGTARFDSDTPASADTKYRIASVSKMITAIGVMQLVEQGKLDLQGDVQDYLGFDLRNPNFPDTPITISMLMSHTSSIRESDASPYSMPIGHDLKEFFEEGSEYCGPDRWAPAEEAPGKFFEYTNLNYGILGTIIEKVSGKRFDEYMTKHIFEPMGLTCSFNPATMSKEAQNQIGTLYRKKTGDNYDPNGTWTAQVDDFTDGYPADGEFADYKIGSNATVFSPQGGLRVSVKDLCAFIQMFSAGGSYNGNQILSQDTIDKMFTPVWTYDAAAENGDTYYDLMNCYGNGVQIFTNTTGDRIVEGQDLPFAGHLGDAYGLYSGVLFDRAKGNGIVYIVGGVGSDPEEYYGDYSTFYKWEEKLMTAAAGFAKFDY